MGKNGDQMTDVSVTAAEDLQTRLKSLGDIQLKKMFGGHGVFESGTMFSLIDKNGGIYF
jgi:TfoX/Sxy family transcriptional regulator of competence genes